MKIDTTAIGLVIICIGLLYLENGRGQLTFGSNGLSIPPINVFSIYRILRRTWNMFMYPKARRVKKKKGRSSLENEETGGQNTLLANDEIKENINTLMENVDKTFLNGQQENKTSFSCAKSKSGCSNASLGDLLAETDIFSKAGSFQLAESNTDKVISESNTHKVIFESNTDEENVAKKVTNATKIEEKVAENVEKVDENFPDENFSKNNQNLNKLNENKKLIHEKSKKENLSSSKLEKNENLNLRKRKNSKLLKDQSLNVDKTENLKIQNIKNSNLEKYENAKLEKDTKTFGLLPAPFSSVGWIGSYIALNGVLLGLYIFLAAPYWYTGRTVERIVDDKDEYEKQLKEIEENMKNNNGENGNDNDENGNNKEENGNYNSENNNSNGENGNYNDENSRDKELTTENSEQISDSYTSYQSDQEFPTKENSKEEYLGYTTYGDADMIFTYMFDDEDNDEEDSEISENDINHSSHFKVHQDNDLRRHDRHFRPEDNDLSRHDRHFRPEDNDLLSRHDRHFRPEDNDLSRHDRHFRPEDNDLLSRHDRHFRTEDIVLSFEEAKFQRRNEQLGQRSKEFSNEKENSRRNSRFRRRDRDYKFYKRHQKSDNRRPISDYKIQRNLKYKKRQNPEHKKHQNPEHKKHQSLDYKTQWRPKYNFKVKEEEETKCLENALCLRPNFGERTLKITTYVFDILNWITGYDFHAKKYRRNEERLKNALVKGKLQNCREYVCSRNKR